jgi:hypothetical protein
MRRGEQQEREESERVEEEDEKGRRLGLVVGDHNPLGNLLPFVHVFGIEEPIVL